jgi:cell division protein FtsZ
MNSGMPLVAIVGVGGAGNNMLTRAIGGGVSPDHCIAVNNDRSELSRSPAINKVLLDGGRLESDEAGLQQVDHRRMSQLSAHRVTPFTAQSDVTIVIAGLGGGTATSTAPLIAQWTRTPIHPVISIVAIPFIHERERRFVALRGLKHMVESCDCTVVVDNAMEDARYSHGGRQADEKASMVIQGLTQLISRIHSPLVPEVLRIMGLGEIAVACSSRVGLTGLVQTAILEALENPSARLPIEGTKGAILLHRGPQKMGDGEAAQAYEVLVSLIGKNIEFVHASVVSPCERTISILLTGYDYGTAVHTFVDFIEDLYDVEYGQPGAGPFSGIQFPLFQMEVPEP